MPSFVALRPARWGDLQRLGIAFLTVEARLALQCFPSKQSPLWTAKLNGHDPYVYLKDVLQRLPTRKNNLITELLSHRWQPALA